MLYLQFRFGGQPYQTIWYKQISLFMMPTFVHTVFPTWCNRVFWKFRFIFETGVKWRMKGEKSFKRQNCNRQVHHVCFRTKNFSEFLGTVIGRTWLNIWGQIQIYRQFWISFTSVLHNVSSTCFGNRASQPNSEDEFELAGKNWKFRNEGTDFYPC